MHLGHWLKIQLKKKFMKKKTINILTVFFMRTLRILVNIFHN